MSPSSVRAAASRASLGAVTVQFPVDDIGEAHRRHDGHDVGAATRRRRRRGRPTCRASTCSPAQDPRRRGAHRDDPIVIELPRRIDVAAQPTSSEQRTSALHSTPRTPSDGMIGSDLNAALLRVVVAVEVRRRRSRSCRRSGRRGTRQLRRPPLPRVVDAQVELMVDRRALGVHLAVDRDVDVAIAVEHRRRSPACTAGPSTAGTDRRAASACRFQLAAALRLCG